MGTVPRRFRGSLAALLGSPPRKPAGSPDSQDSRREVAPAPPLPAPEMTPPDRRTGLTAVPAETEPGPDV